MKKKLHKTGTTILLALAPACALGVVGGIVVSSISKKEQVETITLEWNGRSMYRREQVSVKPGIKYKAVANINYLPIVRFDLWNSFESYDMPFNWIKEESSSNIQTWAKYDSGGKIDIRGEAISNAEVTICFTVDEEMTVNPDARTSL